MTAQPRTDQSASATTPVPAPDITVEPVVPERDAELLHRWVSEERAEFWGLRGKPLEEIRDIYAYIQEQDHLAAYLIHADGVPVALFQTYDPEVDEIGQFYARKPGDIGVHLFVGPGRRAPGVTEGVLMAMAGHVWADQAVQRVVFEPDAKNAKSVAVLHRIGATLGPQVQLPHKTAQFGFMTREAWFAPRA